MGQIVGGSAKTKRCNIRQLSQLGTPAAGEHILVSSDNSMNAAGQGNFDYYIVGDGQKAATALTLKEINQLSIKEAGLDVTNSESISDTGRYYLINDIFIPAGSSFKVTASGTYSWARAIICYNRITSGSGYLRDYTVKGNEYTFTAPDNVTSLQLYIVSGSGSGTISLAVSCEGEIDSKIGAKVNPLIARVSDLENDLPNEEKLFLTNKYYNTITVSDTGWVTLIDNIFIKAGQKFSITIGGSATLGRAILAYNGIHTSPYWKDNVAKNTIYSFVAPEDITKIELYLVNGSPIGTIAIYINAQNLLPQHHFSGFVDSGTPNPQSSVIRIENVHIAKNLMLSARVVGLSSDNVVSFGIGYNPDTTSRRENNAMYFNISSNGIELYKAVDVTNPTLVQTWPVGNTQLSDFSLSLIIDDTKEANWVLIIEDYRGVDVSNVNGSGWIASGEPFVESLTASVDAELSFIPRDIHKKIWVFGDSYTQPITSNMKWPNRLIEHGISSFLLNSLSGLNPVDGYNDFQKLLSLNNKPSFVFWCLGMNGPADADQYTVNETQKTVIDNVLALCIANNITPIFATIPTVPSRQKTALSNYIRSLGVRYVDIAEAVGSTPTGEWSPRLISYDNLHPSQYGALVIAQRVLLDFPEISITE